MYNIISSILCYTYIRANPTVRGMQQWSKQNFQPHHPGGVDTPLSIFFPSIFWGKILYFSVKKGIIHSHRDLNSVSSSTDKTNLLGPMLSRLRSPAPRVCKPPRAAGSSGGGSTSLSLKPAARNSLEFMIIATGGRHVSTSGVHSSKVSPDVSSSSLLSHRLITRARSCL